MLIVVALRNWPQVSSALASRPLIRDTRLPSAFAHTDGISDDTVLSMKRDLVDGGVDPGAAARG